MSIWVVSSNPNKYNVEGALRANGKIEWVTTNNFRPGDSVYIYEVMKPRGRGGIVYKTKVTDIGVPLNEKSDDREFWAGNVYPKEVNDRTRFSRLRLVSAAENGVIPLNELQAYGFTAPQGSAYLLNDRPRLVDYIEAHLN